MVVVFKYLSRAFRRVCSHNIECFLLDIEAEVVCDFEKVTVPLLINIVAIASPLRILMSTSLLLLLLSVPKPLINLFLLQTQLLTQAVDLMSRRCLPIILSVYFA